MSETTAVGCSVTRKDVRSKVTGSARYVSDVRPGPMAYVAAVRSTRHHARITRLDSRASEAVPGILAVITAQDIPGQRTYGAIIEDQPLLAFEHVRFFGEAIALIVGETRTAVELARDRFEVSYEDLPVLLEPDEALAAGAPLLHPNGNLLSHTRIRQGDIAEGFSKATVILEETYEVPRIYQGYLEPEAATAVWSDDAGISVWVSSQMPFKDRLSISRVLNLPEERVQVRLAAIGGSFGAKEDSGVPIMAALAAWKTRRAVQMVLSREESFLSKPKRHPARLHYRIGATTDGRLIALQVRAYLNTGAYASLGPAVATFLTEHLTGPYRISNVQLDTYLVYTNAPISGAMRGFGGPQANFACESLMDALAEKLELDPLELRLRNVWRSGDCAATGVPIKNAEGLHDCITAIDHVRQRMSRVAGRPGRLSGVGMAVCMQAMGQGYGVPDDSVQRLEWLTDGKIRLYLGAPDIGQGLITVAAQVAADALGIDYERIEVADLDTAYSPNGGCTVASRTTYLVCNSILRAATDAVRVLLEEAARQLGVSPELLVYDHGLVRCLDDASGASVEASNVVRQALESGRVLTGTGVFSFPYDASTPTDMPVGMPHVRFTPCVATVRVEVDPELGAVEVCEAAMACDVGKAINPKGVEGQIASGLVMGVGYALTEEMVQRPGGCWTSDLSDYLLPTFADAPRAITPIIIERVAEDTGPYGARGLGEAVLTPVAAAITNAVNNATGIRVRTIPIRREALVRADER